MWSTVRRRRRRKPPLAAITSKVRGATVTPEQLLTFADPLPEPMLLLTSRGLVLAANRAVDKRLGLVRRDLLGRNLADIVTTSTDEIARHLRSCSRSRSLVLGSLDLRGDRARTFA